MKFCCIILLLSQFCYLQIKDKQRLQVVELISIVDVTYIDLPNLGNTYLLLYLIQFYNKTI